MMMRVPKWAALAGLAVVAATTLFVWLRNDPGRSLGLRVPGADHAGAGAGAEDRSNPVLRGTLVRGPGRATDLPGEWPQFRGVLRDGVARDPGKLAREWEGGSPKVMWSVAVGEGYAGPAVRSGRVYLMDYDREARSDALRCLSLGDGQELWRFQYPVPVKRNHGMSRTVPALYSNLVVAIGPKCHVVCLDATSGELKWGLDMVTEFGAKVPEWYTGQCPLVEEDRVILAPGGKDALLLAVEAETGKVVWRSPNPRNWKMTHSSIVTMEWGQRRFYLYCASGGVVAVDARDGSLLWDTPDWKISIATVPSPVPLPDGRIFLSGGYNAGSMMLQLEETDGRIVPKVLYRLKPEVFGATQQTPILLGRHLYGIRPDGDLVCLDLGGKVLWASGVGTRFGLGPFLAADGLIYALDDAGRLTLAEATPASYRQLGQKQVLDGTDAWGPMALVGTRLLARDLTRLVCLEVGSGN